MSRRNVMYRCDSCGRGVTATPGDAIHVTTSRGKQCTDCFGQATPEDQERARKEAERREAEAAKEAAREQAKAEAKARRSAAMKARWDAKTPEEKAAQVARLQHKEPTP